MGPNQSWAACGLSLTHNVASARTHQYRLSVYTFVDCRSIITHSLRARGMSRHPVLLIYDAPLDQKRAIKNRINKGPEGRNQEKCTIEAFRGKRITSCEAYHVVLTHTAVLGAGPGRHLHYERGAVSVTSSGLEEKELQRT